MMKVIVMMYFLLGQTGQAQQKTSGGFEQDWLHRMQLREMEQAAKRSEFDYQRRQAERARTDELFFTESFNKLVQKLSHFADQYNAGTVDAKTVKAVKAAWQKLEKNSAWFKPAEKDEGRDRCNVSEQRN